MKYLLWLLLGALAWWAYRRSRAARRLAAGADRRVLVLARDQLLGLAHRQPLAGDQRRDLGLLPPGVQAEQCARMTQRYGAIAHHAADGVGKGQQPEHVGDRRALPPHGVSNLQLRQPELRDEFLIPLGFFNRIEVGTLQVLDQREREDGLIIEFSHVNGNVLPSECLDGAESPFARDEFETCATRTYEQRLEQSTRPDAVLQLIQICRIELLARLKRIRRDCGNRDRPESGSGACRRWR